MIYLKYNSSPIKGGVIGENGEKWETRQERISDDLS